MTEGLGNARLSLWFMSSLPVFGTAIPTFFDIFGNGFVKSTGDVNFLILKRTAMPVHSGYVYY